MGQGTFETNYLVLDEAFSVLTQNQNGFACRTDKYLLHHTYSYACQVYQAYETYKIEGGCIISSILYPNDFILITAY